MATQFDAIAPAHRKFIEAQQIFFCATAAQDGRVNLSPKGMDSLRVMDTNRIVWRNLTGSGNETAAHLKRVNRITLMWCGFGAQPMIMRAYGSARTLHADAPEFADLDAMFAPSPGARQIYDVTVDMLQTSCGYAVPMYEHVKERPILRDWAEAKGPDGIAAYWAERNQTSIDGMPTGTPMRDA